MFSLAQQSNGHVIVVNHQTGSGKAAWSNGQAIAQNGADIGRAGDALSGTTSCAIGAIKDRTVKYKSGGQYYGFAGFMGVVGEVRGYKGALSTAERRSVECELSKKWSGAMPLVPHCTDGKPDESY